MSSSTVNISFQSELLKQIDSIAKEESRSHSELIRESARMYIERKNRWKSIFTLGENIQVQNKISDICRDRDDHIILECAEKSKADFIITGVQDLLVLETYLDTKILSPADFLCNRK